MVNLGTKLSFSQMIVSVKIKDEAVIQKLLGDKDPIIMDKFFNIIPTRVFNECFYNSLV
jgi:hypothetical protein